MQSMRVRIGALFLAGAILASACGGDDDDAGASTSDTPEATEADESDDTDAEAADGPGAFAAANYTTDLTGVCPDPLRVQLSWLAEPEFAVPYQLIGGSGEMTQNKYSGPLGSTGITLEVLDGGPGLGDGATVASSMYAGNLVQGVTPDLGMFGDGNAISEYGEFPTISVFNSLEKDPQNLVFDPGTYDITDLESLIAAVEGGAQIYVTGKFVGYVQYLIGQGVPEDAFIEGFAGDYDRFIAAGGSLINQGFSTDTNSRLTSEIPEWGKPVEDVYIDDLGYSAYPINVYVTTERLEELSPCLELLVPMMQQAMVDYVNDPTEVNELIAKYNDEGFGAVYWTTSVEHNDAAHQTMVDDGLVGNGDDETLGNAEVERMQTLIDILGPILEAQGVDTFDPSVTPDDIFTDQFLDPSIGL